MVEFELKKYTKNELRFIVKDADKHSLPNLISKLALRHKGVVYSAYIIDHPLVSYPEVVILTDGTVDPLDVLKDIIREAKEMAQSLLRLFDEAVKRYEERISNTSSK